MSTGRSLQIIMSSLNKIIGLKWIQSWVFFCASLQYRQLSKYWDNFNHHLIETKKRMLNNYLIYSYMAVNAGHLLHRWRKDLKWRRFCSTDNVLPTTYNDTGLVAKSEMKMKDSNGQQKVIWMTCNICIGVFHIIDIKRFLFYYCSSNVRLKCHLR